MSIFKRGKSTFSRSYKFWGIELYSVTTEYKSLNRTQKFLGGFISTLKRSNYSDYHTEKLTKILNFTFLKRIDDGNNSEFFLFGKKIKEISLTDKFKKNCFKYLEKDTDDIYFLHGSSGEIFLFLTFALDAYLKKNGSKHPLFLTCQPYHADLMKIVCPELKCKIVKKQKKLLKDLHCKISNHNVYIIFPHTHYKDLEVKIKNNENNNTHYYKEILNTLKISDNEASQRLINIPDYISQSINNKLEQINLNTDNFILITPEAQSCVLLDNFFWVKIIKKLQNLGYDIFVNKTDNSVDLTGCEYKTCNLSIPELFLLAKQAKKIISLRSGLSEILVQAGVQMDIIYTPFRNRHLFDYLNTYEVLSAFNIAGLPFKKKPYIAELNKENMTYNDISEEILKDLISKKHNEVIIKQLSGHSGCIVNLVKKNNTDIYVSKQSGDINYNFRLKKQCKKQDNFVSKSNVKAPKVLNCGYKENLFYFNMEFVQGKTMAEYTNDIKINEITDFMKCLFKSLYWSDNKIDKKADVIFRKKVLSLEKNLSELDFLKDTFNMLKAFDWSKVYKSPCHGDLTLENILVTQDKTLYLIDFLDSFYNSWMIDIAKLLQDLELKWSFRHTVISSNRALRLQVAKETLIEEILNTENGKEKLNTIYHILLLNVIRIYPYTKDEKTFNYLNNAVELLMKKMNHSEIGANL